MSLLYISAMLARNARKEQLYVLAVCHWSDRLQLQKLAASSSRVPLLLLRRLESGSMSPLTSKFNINGRDSYLCQGTLHPQSHHSKKSEEFN